jgi:malate synthase
MLKDELVEEVRKARQAQAARWGFDLNAILGDARRRQTKSKHKVVSFVSKGPKTR